MPMGRRLSLLCCSCLPRKQRDNLSSRSLYPDQDSSGHDDYSDEDDYYPSHARLESLAPASSSSSSNPYSNSFRNNSNPWPSSFSNGRFSKQSSRGSQQRKPNPFRTPYRDDSDDNDDDEAGEGNNNGGGRGSGNKGIGITTFAPYRDDSDSDNGGEVEDGEDRHLRREPKADGSGEPKDESSSNGHGNSALRNPTRIHPKMDVSPYRVFDSVSTPSGAAAAGFLKPQLTSTTMTRARSTHPPRNPQGKMRWHDGDSNTDNEDGEADAEEVIDVDALIAEQERITRELAAQEEALRREEEAAILSKRLAAIRAAEKRGLLRFEGDQLVIPNGDHNNLAASTSTNSKVIVIPSQGRTVQEHDDDGKQRIARERTTSSGASSFVGGVDAFNQELKMMDLDMNTSRNTEKAAARPSTITTTTSSTSTSTSTNTGPSLRRTVSTGVSTSTSTSTNSTPTVAINPREVFNNITSFLKKVDGVIAGEDDSSDEASFSDQEQVLGKGRANLARGPQESRVNGPEETTGALEPKVTVMATAGAPTVQRAVTPVPFDAANQEDDDDDEQPYPADPFNTQTSDLISDNNSSNSNSRRDPQASKERITPDSPVAEKKETAGKTKAETAPAPSAPAPSAPASPVSPVSPIYGHLSESVAAVVPERVYSTFTSFFHSGSSFMGLWGTSSVGIGGADEDDDDGRGSNGGVTADGRRLSNLKYGDPKKYRFNYKDHRNSSTTGASASKRADDDDNSSIDDYDF
ncbi:hypothetical protein BG015_009748 [Linnemannia schmuckeri]|uniref:Uncharacterized protein n=1 Tax=Linnemannia schmuckeri TaxID=64567 RepID=A0A9P5RVH8_9FUNG|nr:hypothetical protein BG015_009748 [Linnemannia schmuckeri]